MASKKCFWSLSNYQKTIQTLYQKEEGIKTRENIQSFEFAPFKFNHVIQDNNFKQEFIPLEFLNHFKAVKFDLNLDLQNL